MFPKLEKHSAITCTKFKSSKSLFHVLMGVLSSSSSFSHHHSTHHQKEKNDCSVFFSFALNTVLKYFMFLATA